jgi:hypothetical protein
MLRRVDLVRTDVSEERSISIIRITRIGELGTTFAVTNKPTHISFFVGLSDRHLLAKFSANFADKGMSPGHRGGSLTSLISGFYTGAATFLSSSSFIVKGLSGRRSRPTATQKN